MTFGREGNAAAVGRGITIVGGNVTATGGDHDVGIGDGKCAINNHGNS